MPQLADPDPPRKPQHLSVVPIRLRRVGRAQGLRRPDLPSADRLGGEYVEEPQRGRHVFPPPGGDRALESFRFGQPLLQGRGDGHELLALRVQQRARVGPGAVEEGQLGQQLGSHVAGAAGRPGEPG